MARSLFFSALLMSPALALADPPAGQIDPTFGSFDNGVIGLQLESFDLGGDFYDVALAMARDTQGHLLLAGAAQTDDGYCLGLMRFNVDGQLDTDSFGFNANHVAKGKVCHPILAAGNDFGSDFDLAVLPGGGFFVGGFSNTSPFVCRFQADGSIMNSFGNGTGCIVLPQITTTSWPAPVLLVHGASLLIIANHSPDTTRIPMLARVSIASGAIEPFGQQMSVPLLSSNADAFVWDAALTTDGDVLATGSIEVDPLDYDAFVARFDLSKVQPDLGFSGDGMARFKFNKGGWGADYATAMTLLPDGDILAAGSIQMPGRGGVALMQLDGKTGALSPAFHDGQPLTYDPCMALPAGCESVDVGAIASTGAHIVMSGSAGGVLFAARLHPDGVVDQSFGQQGLARIDLGFNGNTNSGATGMALQDGRIVLAGSAYNGNDTDFALLRLSDGRLFSDQFEVDAP